MASAARANTSNFLKSAIKLKESSKKINYVSPFLYSNIFKRAFETAKKFLILAGGRASGKTTAALIKGIDSTFSIEYKNSSILIFRELKGSLEGIYKKTQQLIEKGGLTQYFKFLGNKIINLTNNCTFYFKGARSSGGSLLMTELNKLRGTVPNIKMVIFEEGQEMSEEVLNVILPSVARDDNVAIVGQAANQDNFNDVQWIVCMNIIKRKDDIIKIFETQESYHYTHVNIYDVEPEFQDKSSLKLALAAINEYYYRHVWLGQPFHLFAGFPFSDVRQETSTREFETFAFLDPSFAGGDYTALNFIAEYKGKLITWGYCWRESWITVKHEIKDLLIEHNAVSFYYESNAIATAPQEVFSEINIEANPRYSLGDKHNRIYQASYATKQDLILIKNKSNMAFIDNFLDYNNKATNDDAADAFALNLMAHGVISTKKVGNY